MFVPPRFEELSNLTAGSHLHPPILDLLQNGPYIPGEYSGRGLLVKAA